MPRDPRSRARTTQYVPPINRLPPEVLSYILHLSSLIDYTYGPSLPSMTVRFLFQSVCAQWRNIILHTPSQWSSINLFPDMIKYRYDGDPGVFNMFLVEACIQRSRQHPLDIYIVTTKDSSIHPSILYGVLSLLIPHLLRWRSLVLYIRTWDLMYGALRQIEPRMSAVGAPLLESMRLMHGGPAKADYTSKFEPAAMKHPAFLSTCNNTIVRARLPRLRVLTLHRVHVDWTALASMLAHSRSPLKKLDLGAHCLDVRPSLEQFQNLLKATPHLTQLVLQMTGPHQLQPTSFGNIGPPIVLPHLVDFTIGDDTTFDGQVLLKCFAAPNVKTLTVVDHSSPEELRTGDLGWLLVHLAVGHEGITTQIHNRTSHRNVPITHAPDFQALFPLVEEVRLRWLRAHQATVQTFFRGFRNVRKLELEGCSPEVFEALKPFVGGGVPLPRLKVLNIRRPNCEFYDDEDTVDPLFDIAEDRQNAGYTLPNVNIIGKAKWEGRSEWEPVVGTLMVSVFDEEASDEAERSGFPSDSESDSDN